MTSTRLAAMGYRPFFQEKMAQLPDRLFPGRVVGQHRRQWDVVSEAGACRAVLAGRLWAEEGVSQLDDAQPAVGDWVALEQNAAAEPPVITQVLARQSSLARTSAKRRGARQTIAANVDWVGIVAAFTENATDHVARRSLHPRRIERYLAAVRQGGASPLVVLNKADLSESAAAQTQELAKRLAPAPVVAVSSVSEGGLDPLLDRLTSGQTLALVGLSGVGKSSIVNRILGSNKQSVGQERSQDARGRHTTTGRALLTSPSGLLLIDTPGMREFGLAEAQADDLAAFADITRLAEKCQFRDCGHGAEPGCHVRQAVRNGQLADDRLQNFLALRGETRDAPRPRPSKSISRKRQKYPSRRSGKNLGDDSHELD